MFKCSKRLQAAPKLASLFALYQLLDSPVGGCFGFRIFGKCPTVEHRMILIAACAAFLLSGTLLAQSPKIDRIAPRAAVPGETTLFTLAGENLDGAMELWTSFPAKTVQVQESNPTGKETKFLVSVPREVSPGIGAIRLAATKGLSSLHLVFIDDLPVMVAPGNHHSPEAASPVPFPSAMDGGCEAFKTNYYRFHASRNQPVSVEVLAHRLGSNLDPVVRLLDFQGNELLFRDDEPGSGPDPRFTWIAPEEGDYLLEIRDLHYNGGRDYFYRLRLGHFPLATIPYPLALKQDSISAIRFLGPAVPELAPVVIQAPDWQSRWKQLGVSFVPGLGSGWVSLPAGSLPDWLEVEPNNRPEAANAISIPVAIHGRFETDQDRDYFEFDAASGVRLTFAVRSRTLGSPCDVFMRITDVSGAVLAESTVQGAEDPILTHRFSEAGTYHLMVEELNRFGGPDHAYRIEVDYFRPGFSPSVETDQIETPQGAPVEYKVTVSRREYEGAITMALADASAEFILEDGNIPEKKNEATIKLIPPAHWEPGRIETFRLIGRAIIQEKEFSASASTMPALRKLFPLMIYPPEQLDGIITLGITPAKIKGEDNPVLNEPAQ
jgi:hypothetical protein